MTPDEWEQLVRSSAMTEESIWRERMGFLADSLEDVIAMGNSGELLKAQRKVRALRDEVGEWLTEIPRWTCPRCQRVEEGQPYYYQGETDGMCFSCFQGEHR